jgi:hypothetical protein
MFEALSGSIQCDSSWNLAADVLWVIVTYPGWLLFRIIVEGEAYGR